MEGSKHGLGLALVISLVLGACSAPPVSKLKTNRSDSTESSGSSGSSESSSPSPSDTAESDPSTGTPPPAATGPTPTPTPAPTTPPSTGGAPTWTKIWTSYLAAGTIGNCAASGCHAQTSTASGAYSWLSGKGQITATNAPIADTSQSCLSWLGGDMPPSGPGSSAAAASDLAAWAAAGAPND
jgi:hypothetical protein